MIDKLVKHTFFSSRPMVGDRQLMALNAGRMAILEERGNPLAVGDEGVASAWAVHEAFYVVTAEVDVLVEHSILPKDEWMLEVKKFALGVSDEELNEFWVIFQSELAEINEAKVEVVEKRGKRKSSVRREK